MGLPWSWWSDCSATSATYTPTPGDRPAIASRQGALMRATTLLPDAALLHLEALLADEHGVTMVVATTGDTACCPGCGHPSARCHSRRCRTIADVPWQGLAVRVELHLRRFYCDVSTCARRTFTEPLPSVVAPYGRRTRRLASLVEAVAMALGGEAGARLLARLGCALS